VGLFYNAPEPTRGNIVRERGLEQKRWRKVDKDGANYERFRYVLKRLFTSFSDVRIVAYL